MVNTEGSFDKFFKSFDAYGKSIGLTLHSRDVHKTILGGIMTLLIFLL